MDRIAALRPTAVNAILRETAAARAQGRELFPLMRGEPDLPTPAHIVEACTRALRDGRTGYPDNRGELKFREAIALKLGRDNGLRFNPATEILATSGATFGIYAALTALLDEGDEVLLPDPVYDAYRSPIHLAGGVARPVPAVIANGRFTLSVEALREAWSPRVKLMILNTPWNPTGTVFTRAELDGVEGFCAERGIILISDEIYEAITYGDHAHVSPRHAIHINSLSKTYAMTGWRVGYCAGPAAIIDRMFMVLAQSSRGPATFVQDAATAALSGPQDCVAGMRAEYAERREQTIAALAGIPGVRVLEPEGGFFAMLDVRELGAPSNEIRRRLLDDHGVVVVHGSAYGDAGEGTLRVSFAAGGEPLRQGLHRLREALVAWQS